MWQSIFSIDSPLWTFVGYGALIVQLTLAVGVILRVIFTRHPPGSAFAWIMLTVVLPYVGFALYVMLGERPIGRWRAFKLKQVLASWEQLSHASGSTSPEDLPQSQRHKGLVALAQRLGDMPMTVGSQLELIAESNRALERMIADVQAAKHSVSMEFYIWDQGGYCDTMCQALMDCAQRGVLCRVLVDGVGSHKFLRSTWPERMRQAGVHVNSALPVSFFPFSKGRADLRLHRKTVIIDDVIGYTGSLNMIDPTVFNASEGVGEWVDAVVRVQGRAVADLNQVFAFDWALQPDDEGQMPELIPVPKTAPVGQARMTVIASGPTTLDDTNRRLIVEALNCARSCIHITTPYFIPDEAVMLAIENAALRGVDVRLCLPKECDSKFVTWAGRRHFSDLLSAGVHVRWFRQGVLHTKAITVDDEFSLFGTVNLDNRSLHLNFEMLLLIFDRDFVRALSRLQTRYENDSEALVPEIWHARTVTQRFMEGLCHLLSPIL